MNTSSVTSDIPAYLETPAFPPEIQPPVETRLQGLPFDELSWETFEKLCLRLARSEGRIEFCRIYGERGDDQEGIDLYARTRSSERYRVYQCKRVRKFGPAKIKKTVSEFLEGEWADKTEAFVLCTSESLRPKKRTDEVERQRARLNQEEIELEIWDQNSLSQKLKDAPRVVDDFFGRQYVKLFNGEDTASTLGDRLDVSQIAELRRRLRSFYSHVFAKHDQGVPAVSMGTLEALPLRERYVVPDISDQRRIDTEGDEEQEDDSSKREDDLLYPLYYDDLPAHSGYRKIQIRKSRSETTLQRSTTVSKRRNIEEWLSASQRNIILGGPGSGKSALLRFIALDLLEEAPAMDSLVNQWGSYLPVWVPFGRWTKVIDSSDASGGSLSDLLESWLEDWSEERLWPLVKRALEDERLLLLVDGLDEWTDEDAAAVALQRLLVFIEQRNIPAILTSRPHGYKRLRMGETEWQIGELADFSFAQQRDLARLWFSHWAHSSQPDGESEDSDVLRRAKKETDALMSELRRTSDLRDLAKVPLLLSLLISLRLQQASLPRNRFKAYDSLIEQLLLKHPKKRRHAAAITDEILPELSDRDLKRVLSHLAFYIHTEHPEGLINIDQATEVVRAYLKDEEQGLGLRHHEAQQLSGQICEVSQDVLGLLVRMAPHQVGFFHRTFLQHFAAYHLTRLSRREQKKVLDEKCTDHQWRDVILGQFFLTQRPEDIRVYVDEIRNKEVGPAERRAVELLLSEVAFGEFNCPTKLARELAKEAFSRIELGVWIPHRERLLHNAIDGLRSSTVGRQVRQKLREWFPCRQRWRGSLFEAMKEWPEEPELRDVLWRGLHDEEVGNQRAAAATLVAHYSGDEEFCLRLAALVRSASAPDTRAAALEALVDGWSEYEETQALVDQALQAAAPQLQFVGIKGKVCQGDQDQQHLEMLFDLLDRGLSYRWEGDTADLILTGWPNADYVKQECLQRVEKYGSVREVAQEVLLAGFPRDHDVVQFCVREIQTENLPFVGSGHTAWRLLAQNFRDCPDLVEAIDEWIGNQEHHEPEVSFAALVGRTEEAKRTLIDHVQNSWIPFWAAHALLEGWGMEDKEVAEVLSEVAYGPIGDASKIAHLLPDIIEDESEARERLMEILRSSECERYDFVLKGLIRLGSDGATEIVDIVLGEAGERWRNSFGWQAVASQLVQHFSSESGVREFAEQQLQDREGRRSVAAIAYGFADDLSIRNKVRQIACPLPTELRDIIVRRLREGAGSDDFALSLLKLYDWEEDASIKTQASIGYHERLITSGADTSEAEEYLAQAIVCYGMDHDKRRQAAFCGLAILRRLDIMLDAKERNDRRCTIDIKDRSMLNLPLVRFILENWKDLRSIFGNEMVYRLTKGRSSTERFWKTISVMADQYSHARDEVSAFFAEKSEKDLNIEALRFIARAHPGSQLLFDYCIRAIQSEDARLSLAAAEVLGANFGGEEIPSEIVPSELSVPVPEPTIIALCEGWPESGELSQVVALLREEDQRMTLRTWTHLVNSRGDAKRVYELIISWEDELRERTLHPRKVSVRPVLSRLKKDEELASLLVGKLKEKPSRFQKINYPRMLSTSRGLSSETEEWCIAELERQLDGSRIPEDSYDLLLRESRPVAHALLEAIDA